MHGPWQCVLMLGCYMDWAVEHLPRSPTSIVTECVLVGSVSKTFNQDNPKSYVSVFSQRKVPLTLPPLILVSKILVRCFSCAT